MWSVNPGSRPAQAKSPAGPCPWAHLSGAFGTNDDNDRNDSSCQCPVPKALRSGGGWWPSSIRQCPVPKALRRTGSYLGHSGPHPGNCPAKRGRQAQAPSGAWQNPRTVPAIDGPVSPGGSSPAVCDAGGPRRSLGAMAAWRPGRSCHRQAIVAGGGPSARWPRPAGTGLLVRGPPSRPAAVLAAGPGPRIRWKRCRCLRHPPRTS